MYICIHIYLHIVNYLYTSSINSHIHTSSCIYIQKVRYKDIYILYVSAYIELLIVLKYKYTWYLRIHIFSVYIYIYT